ncbi:iron-containing alcohol dehydrogenase [Vibrio astriarenae]
MFNFMTSGRVIFGEGSLAHSLSLIRQYGYSVLLVTGKGIQRSSVVLDYLGKQQLRYQHIAVGNEPNITMVEEAAVLGRKFNPEVIVAFGGGSVIDMGKALAAVIPNQGNVYDYVETVGRNVPLKTRPLPVIAIPTTASTGSEVTKNAVLRSGQDRIKVSLRDQDMLPKVAIIDPTLTYGTSQSISARGAMDTFTHLMEAYVCNEPNSFSDMLCEEGFRRLSRSVIDACLHDDHKAREDLSFAAMLGGMALTNAKLGGIHGLASALGGEIKAPHGVITGRLAPFVMRENILNAEANGEGLILERYQRMAQILTGRQNANLHDAVLWVESILSRLDIPELGEFGVCSTTFELVAESALKSVDIRGNASTLDRERLINILESVCECDGSCTKQTEIKDDYLLVELVHDSSAETSDI